MSCDTLRIAWLGNKYAFLGSTQERQERWGLASCRKWLWPALTKLLHAHCWGHLAPFTGCFGRDCMHCHGFCSKAVTGLYLTSA